LHVTGTLPVTVPHAHPIPILLAAISGWVHREQADTIAYLIKEHRELGGLLRSYHRAA